MRSQTLVAFTLLAALPLSGVVGALVAPPAALSQGARAATSPPFDLGDDKVISEGAQLFRQTCTGYCHGKDGGPSRAPKLRAAKLEQGYVYARIAKGSPNGMPGFEASLPQDKIWKLVAYVMSLTKAEDK
jgi:mono/diheme cytochrome c family protein